MPLMSQLVAYINWTTSFQFDGLWVLFFSSLCAFCAFETWIVLQLQPYLLRAHWASFCRCSGRSACIQFNGTATEIQWNGCDKFILNWTWQWEQWVFYCELKLLQHWKFTCAFECRTSFRLKVGQSKNGNDWKPCKTALHCWKLLEILKIAGNRWKLHENAHRKCPWTL